MGNFLLRLITNAIAIWLTTLLLSGVTVRPFSDDQWWQIGLSYLIVAFIFAVVNGILGTIVKIVAIPLYVITLGLISFVINGVLLLIVASVTEWFGFGLRVENLGWAILGAIVISIINAIIGAILRPQQRRR
ncbi:MULTISPECIES: phage holin family protein [Mycetocola]|uniref:Phage holin family protein n=1 Tax=Mycetocola lacteus TaxID=76637 RepID=A0A3L7AXA6_9MICO|nr:MULTISPECIES: phage holin family protein [Mycetocola]MCS4277161.1 putative membrane protein [Mycetocola sp. BIGb0189]RLP84170.1 phage holin family protein [Mycetocola lacteus]